MANILETVVFAEGEDTAAADTQTTSTTEVNGQQEQGAMQTAPGWVSTISTLLPFVLIIVLLYFMMIRPQRKRETETREMINAMKVGDKVVTIGGICGKVVKIKDEFIFIETGNIGTQDEKSIIKMERDAVKAVETTKK